MRIMYQLITSTSIAWWIPNASSYIFRYLTLYSLLANSQGSDTLQANKSQFIHAW